MNREELQRIRDMALVKAKSAGPSQILAMRAWGDLAAAADRLDAMMARENPVARSRPSRLEVVEESSEDEDLEEDFGEAVEYDPALDR